jgi:hypothetical protein
VGRVCPLVYEDVYVYVYGYMHICMSLCEFSARVLLGGSLRVWIEDGQPCRTELI